MLRHRCSQSIAGIAYEKHSFLRMRRIDFSRLRDHERFLCIPAKLVRVRRPPEIKEGTQVTEWAAKELDKLGGLSSHEIALSVLVCIALVLWIFGGTYVNATTAALLVICLMLVLGIVTWADITKDSAGLEHSRLVRHPRSAGRRSRSRGIRQVDGRSGGESHGRLFADISNHRAVADQLLRPLHVRQRYRARDCAHSSVAGRRLNRAQYEHAAVGAVAFSRARHHGHHHAIRYRSKPGLLRQRLSTFYGLLAARSDLWIDLSRRIYGNLATLAARTGVIGNIEITFHETRKSTSARHNADLEVSTYQPLAIGIYIAQYKRCIANDVK